jgi:YidC/Oxa1 family membrane protein insertase
VKVLRPRLLLLPVLVLLAAAALGGPVLAETPSPAPSVAPTVQPAATSSSVGSPATASTAPCPNPTPAPTQSLLPGQTPHPVRASNLCPAELKSDPFSLLAWIFTPIFQAIFLALAFAYRVIGDIGLAIIVVTILIRLILVPIYRKQLVSSRRIQVIQPELTALKQKYRGDRNRISQEQMRLYKERGVNPASGCLPSILTMFLLFPMYSVFSSGLTAPDISSMLTVFGVKLVDVPCQVAAASGLAPCINPTVAWLGNLNASKPEILFTIPGIGFGVSLLALASAAFQLVQTRMMMPASADPQTRTQQRTFLLLPLFSVVYGSFLPSGLFIYWIVTTVFSIGQQYLVTGWGGLFPLFGWTPAFVRNHAPRFPVNEIAPRRDTAGATERPAQRRSAEDNATGTVRPNRSRARTSRRGRRR